MIIDCCISETCSSEAGLRKTVLEAVKLEAVDAVVNIYRIYEMEAKSLGLMGSPSVLVEGADILPGEIGSYPSPPLLIFTLL